MNGPRPPDGSPLAATFLQRLAPALEARRDPVAAAAMSAYMRGQFAFFGISAPTRAALFRELIRDLPRPTEQEVTTVALGCWEQEEREYQYLAIAFVRKHLARCSAGLLATVQLLITRRSWWDTVDELAQHVVGPLVAAHPELLRVMDEWIESPNLWLARSAILYQNRYRQSTDQGRLFAYCGRRAADSEFFLRKAMGWALREYSKTAPGAVARFVAAHQAELSALSRREALRLIGDGGGSCAAGRAPKAADGIHL